MSEAAKYINPIIQSWIHANKNKRDSEEDLARQKMQKEAQAQADRHFQATHDLEKERLSAENKYREAAQLLNLTHLRASAANQNIQNSANGLVTPDKQENFDNPELSQAITQTGNIPPELLSSINQPTSTSYTVPNPMGGPATPVLSPKQIGINLGQIAAPTADIKQQAIIAEKAAEHENRLGELKQTGQNSKDVANINAVAAKDRAIFTAGEAFKRTKYSVDNRSKDAKLDRTLAEEHRRTDAEVKMHDANPITKNFVVLSQLKNFVNSMPDDTNSPTDDQGLIYGFAKGMDPSGTVKEGEYATVKKYSQSWADQLGVNLGRVLDNGGLLTPEARKLMKATIAAKVDATEREYADYRSGIAGRIDRKVGRAGAGEEALGSYQGGNLSSPKLVTTKQETNSAGGVLDPIMTKKKGYKVYRSE